MKFAVSIWKQRILVDELPGLVCARREDAVTFQEQDTASRERRIARSIHILFSICMSLSLSRVCVCVCVLGKSV
jgi:hypothetical protein